MAVEAFFRPRAAVATGAMPLRRRDDAALIEIIDGYELRAGLASPDEVVALMRWYWPQPVSVLAKWIIARKVVSFAWRHQIQLPIFQFEQPRMTPHPAIAECAAELGAGLDDAAFAAWFVHPCDALALRIPLDRLQVDPESVIEAARRTGRAASARRP